MSLITVLMSGGALVAGTRLYQENKKKKEMPWTAYAKKIGVLKPPQKKTRLLSVSSSLKEAQDTITNKMQGTLQTFKEDRLTLFSIRSQQMEEFVGSEISEAEKKINRLFTIASANLALAGMSLFYHPLLWVVVPIQIYTAIPIYKDAYKAVVKEQRVSSNVLETVLITGMLSGGYFYLNAITTWYFILTGKILFKVQDNSKKSLADLFEPPPHSVWVLTDEGVEVEMAFEKLQSGDIVMVSAGQTICVDGVITTGVASIDQHKLTGESQPAEKGIGDSVFASTIVLAGRIGVRIEKTGEETVAMQIGKILDETTEYKNSLQSQGEVIADRMTGPTLGISALFALLLGYTSGITVLTNEFGYRMRYLAPTSMLIYLNIASQQGILIKDGRSLELLNQIDTIVFDKTGTLTLEQPTVGQIHTYNDTSEDDVLRYAAAAEYGQTHPIAKAILTAANERELAWPKIVNARYEMGYGIQVNLLDRVVRVGSDKFMLMNDIKIPSQVKDVQEYCHEHGHSLVIVAFDLQVVGLIELHATIRPEAKEVVNALRQRNMSMYIISGDHEAPTKKLAETLGIENYFANTLPENKANLVSQLQEEGKSVCFIGDGINDSIALKQAHVSVSLRGATMIATDTAQIVLMDESLNNLAKMWDIAQDLEARMKTNFLISTIPSVICIGGIIFFHWGIVAGMTLTATASLTGLTNSIMPLFTYKERYGKDEE